MLENDVDGGPRCVSPVIVELIGSSLPPGRLSLFQGDDVKAMARRLIIICMIYDSLNKFLPLLFQTTVYSGNDAYQPLLKQLW
jgi:hypothetical protein